jgi:Fe-S-cluster containining protein
MAKRRRPTPKKTRSEPTYKGSCLEGCGACCDPVTIGYTQDEVAHLRAAGRISEEQAEWVTKVLVPMTAKEAKEVAPWLFKGRYREVTGGVDTATDTMTLYYRCTWFDRDTRVCTHYDERPSVCRDYPMGAYQQATEAYVLGVGPVAVDLVPALPPCCGYLVDFDQEPEPIWVTLGVPRVKEKT